MVNNDLPVGSITVSVYVMDSLKSALASEAFKYQPEQTTAREESNNASSPAPSVRSQDLADRHLDSRAPKENGGQ